MVTADYLKQAHLILDAVAGETPALETAAGIIADAYAGLRTNL